MRNPLHFSASLLVKRAFSHPSTYSPQDSIMAASGFNPYGSNYPNNLRSDASIYSVYTPGFQGYTQRGAPAAYQSRPAASSPAPQAASAPASSTPSQPPVINQSPKLNAPSALNSTISPPKPAPNVPLNIGRRRPMPTISVAPPALTGTTKPSAPQIGLTPLRGADAAIGAATANVSPSAKSLISAPPPTPPATAPQPALTGTTKPSAPPPTPPATAPQPAVISASKPNSATSANANPYRDKNSTPEQRAAYMKSKYGVNTTSPSMTPAQERQRSQQVSKMYNPAPAQQTTDRWGRPLNAQPSAASQQTQDYYNRTAGAPAIAQQKLREQQTAAAKQRGQDRIAELKNRYGKDYFEGDEGQKNLARYQNGLY